MKNIEKQAEMNRVRRRWASSCLRTFAIFAFSAPSQPYILTTRTPCSASFVSLTRSSVNLSCLRRRAKRLFATFPWMGTIRISAPRPARNDGPTRRPSHTSDATIWIGARNTMLIAGASCTRNCVSFAIRFWIWPVLAFPIPDSRRHLW